MNELFGSEMVHGAGIRKLIDQQPQRLPVLGGFESHLQQHWGRQFLMLIDWTPTF